MTYKKIRGMSIEELIEEHDKRPNYDFTQTELRNEIELRNQEKQTKTIVHLTCWITIMTIIMTISTILNIVIAAIKPN
jgi:hypothetical protein